MRFLGRALFLVLLFCLLYTSPISAEPIRGAWVSAWNSGYLTPEEADATIDAAKRAMINTLFVQVRKVGDAYYDSSLEPRGSNLVHPNYDPLAYMIEKARAEGMQVHAWVNVFRIWKAEDKPSDARHLMVAHPEWLNKTYKGKLRAEEGYFLDPGVPEVRIHTVAVIEEIVSKYDVDGIHLDYIRYPGRDWGYSDIALEKFFEETGRSNMPKPTDRVWQDWRRDQVSSLVKLVKERVSAVRPTAVVSAATIGWGGCPRTFSSSSPYSSVMQDWKSWLNRSILDINVPMNYKMESKSKHARDFRNWLSGFKRWSGDSPTYVGIDIHNNSVDHVLQQIEAVRKSGLEGFVVFSFNDSEKREELVRGLSQVAWGSSTMAKAD